ncbi:MAG: hypothetical protein MK185_17795 [Saccharospirillaceae bacterium]|nr:hypothetical protein [Saccharospirillaceae bacterium]
MPVVAEVQGARESTVVIQLAAMVALVYNRILLVSMFGMLVGVVVLLARTFLAEVAELEVPTLAATAVQILTVAME